MEIQNSTKNDLAAILNLYATARKHQVKQQVVVWPDFDVEMIEKEIETNHQWKIVIDGKIACVWATTLNDEAIWEGKDKNDAIYIHRIATNADSRGNNFVQKIVEWAKGFARKHNREYVRLDTLGNNTRLIDYYVKSGFDFLGIFELENTSSLPLHYQKEPQCCLFEVAV